MLTACDTTVPIGNTAGSAGATGSSTIVGNIAAAQVYVCSYTISMTGTNPTFQFIGGTGTNCATPQSPQLMSAVPVTANTPLSMGSGVGAIFETLASQNLCLVIGGTGTPTAYGFITYAQY